MSATARDKAQARWLVEGAIHRGELVRPERCEECNRLGEVHAHHADYSKPLSVRWLCRRCHAAEHATEPEWLEEAKRLRDQGYTYAQVAEAVGVAHSTAYKRLNPAAARDYARRSNAMPHRKTYKRAHERQAKTQVERRGVCEECGGPMGVGIQWDGVCKPCQVLIARGRNRQRRELIERWWAMGWSMHKIAHALGISKGGLAREINDLREAGADIPYRRPAYAVRRARQNAA